MITLGRFVGISTTRVAMPDHQNLKLTPTAGGLQRFADSIAWSLYWHQCVTGPGCWYSICWSDCLYQSCWRSLKRYLAPPAQSLADLPSPVFAGGLCLPKRRLSEFVCAAVICASRLPLLAAFVLGSGIRLVLSRWIFVSNSEFCFWAAVKCATLPICRLHQSRLQSSIF